MVKLFDFVESDIDEVVRVGITLLLFLLHRSIDLGAAADECVPIRVVLILEPTSVQHIVLGLLAQQLVDAVEISLIFVLLHNWQTMRQLFVAVIVVKDVLGRLDSLALVSRRHFYLLWLLELAAFVHVLKDLRNK